MNHAPMMRVTAALLLILLLPITELRSALASEVHVDRGKAGMVVCDTAVASRIGRQVLMDGGNAVDAAVATAFALAVSWPEAGNIGGGGFMIIRPADGKDAVCVDYRETAPLAMNATSFNRTDTTFSQKAVGVPGTVRGLWEAHRRYGKLSWSKVVTPSVRLAAKGVVVDAPLARSINSVLQRPSVQQSDTYSELRRVYGTADGSPWQVGASLVLPELSDTLDAIAKQGADGFYAGRTAKLLVKEMQRGDGLISLEDLRQYRAKVRPVMRGTFRGYTILGAPPPSSGGTCVIQALNILENFDLASRDRYHPENIHLIAETCRRVFADRARSLGDPEFTEIPNHLTSKAYAKELADSIQRDRASSSQAIASEIPLTPESDNTTHFSVIDADGMAVSNTYTLEASWGSRLVVAGAGFVLNNEMGDFNWFPGETTRRGRIGTAANLVAPGKRMLSSQTPTIVEKDGQVVLITGSPGGRTIINTVLCIVLGVTEFSMDAATAVTQPRMHHQWFPDRLELERLDTEPHASVVDTLRKMGHEVSNRSVQGSAHTIAINPRTGERFGIADYRRGGRPAATESRRLALWDFSESIGTKLSASRSILGEASWIGELGGASTDGLDRLKLAHDSGDKPSNATFDLPAGTKSLTIEIKIDSGSLMGNQTGEQFGVQAIDSEGEPVAQVILGRFEDRQIHLSDATSLSQARFDYDEFDSEGVIGSTVIRLDIDGTKSQRQILVRRASSQDWVESDLLPVDRNRTLSKIRLQLTGPVADRGESILVDRIDVQTDRD